MNTSTNRFLFILTVLYLTGTVGLIDVTRAEEGMYPISELERLDLVSLGIDLTADELFNSQHVSLVDGICRVNGCTGSFISAEGLIITNHHCAYEAIQQASTPDRDLLADGFQAKTRSDEIPAAGYVVRITESYRDVSSQVLSVVEPGMNYLARTDAIRKQSRQLEKEAEAQHPGLRAEVAEMFIGKTYVLFLYTFLRDVRLVFAPPASIGNFGGEQDNWQWPRHTGDFALMRAYTDPRGASAMFDESNIAYRPKRVIRVNANGANEGDGVFLLGYPGRTVRHQTASFVETEQRVRLPLIVDLYGWQMDELINAGANDRAVELKMLSRLRSLQNVEKRSRGQLLGLERANILAARQRDEERLAKFIAADPQRARRFGGVLPKLDALYQQLQVSLPLEMHLEQLRTAPRLMAAAWFLFDSASERAKPDVERELPYADKNFDQTVQLVRNSLRDFHGPTDQRLLRGLLERLHAIDRAQPGNQAQPWLVDLQMVDAWVDVSQLSQPEFFAHCLQLDPAALAKLDDPLLQWMHRLYPIFMTIRQSHKTREGQLGELYGELLEVKQVFQSTDFIPDANGTLRLTSGRVRGYHPTPDVFQPPVSTFRGALEKTTGVEPFITPAVVLDAWHSRRFGNYTHPHLHDIPVALLYDTDTTGGNSGSPVLNRLGQLVGVNFDRCFEATINDFAWNKDYSRSIGVDIRYVLWLIDIVYGANHLIDEIQAINR